MKKNLCQQTFLHPFINRVRKFLKRMDVILNQNVTNFKAAYTGEEQLDTCMIS